MSCPKLENLPDAAHESLNALFEYIPIREWVLQNKATPEAVEAIRQTDQHLFRIIAHMRAGGRWQDVEEPKEARAVINALQQQAPTNVRGISERLYDRIDKIGWYDQSTCRLDWATYACWCRDASKRTDGTVPAVKKYTVPTCFPDGVPEFYMEANRVANPPWEGPVQSSGSGWSLGKVLGLTALGVGAVFLYRSIAKGK